MNASERAAVRSTVWMTVGAAAAIPALVVPAPDDPLLTLIVHLVGLVGFSFALTFHLVPLLDEPWFVGSRFGARARAAVSGAWVVILVTGATGLVTLATSAALRFDPSLQFLQLLSSMDIAWVVAALVIGFHRRFGGRVAFAGGVALGVVCVWSIWNYLNTVGFTVAGGWLVDGGEIARLVLPFDLAAAVMSIAAFTIGVRAIAE